MAAGARSGPLRALALAALCIAAGAAGAEGTRLAAAASSQVRLEGETNIHDWQCRTGDLDVAAYLSAAPDVLLDTLREIEEGANRKGALQALPEQPGLTASFTLSIPIDGLDCGNRRMERDLRSTLEAEEFPAIHYGFNAVEQAFVAPSEGGGPPLITLVVAGQISLAGQSRTVLFPVEARRVSGRSFQLRGRLPVRMTDFGIEPPQALLGLIQARDRLTVEVDLLLEIVDDRLPAAWLTTTRATHGPPRGVATTRLIERFAHRTRERE